MTVEEARKFLAWVVDHRLFALWVTVLMLGLQRGEACGLRWEHVDFDARTLRVAQSLQRVGGELRELPPKTNRSNRTVPLPSRVLHALAAHHAAMQAEHGSLSTTQRYLHPNHDAVLGAGELLTNYLRGSQGGPTLRAV